MKKSENQKKQQGTYRKDRENSKLDDTIKSLDSVPKLPRNFNSALEKPDKKWFRLIATTLQKSGVLTELDVPALALFAKKWTRWEWANTEIQRLNEQNPGSGYIQEFQSGAKQKSAELQVLESAEKAIMSQAEEFGMTFKSRAAIVSFIQDNKDQLDLFDQFGEALDYSQPLCVIGE